MVLLPITLWRTVLTLQCHSTKVSSRDFSHCPTRDLYFGRTSSTRGGRLQSRYSTDHRGRGGIPVFSSSIVIVSQSLCRMLEPISYELSILRGMSYSIPACGMEIRLSNTHSLQHVSLPPAMPAHPLVSGAKISDRTNLLPFRKEIAAG